MGVPEPKRESGRSEILVVARRLFMSRGYRAVSTRDIADAVGVTQPAIYHHFGGKEALYVAVMEEELAAISARLDAAGRLDGPVVDRLVTAATVLAERGDHDLSQMFHDLRQEISESNRQRIGIAFRDAMLAPLLVMIEALEREGAINLSAAGMERPEVAMLLLSNVRMLVDARRGPAGGRNRTHEEIGRLAVGLLLNGVGTRTTLST